jgi:hypothetical protein
MSTGRLHGGFSRAVRVFLAAVKAWNVVKFDIDHPRATRAPHEWRFTVNEQLILEDIFAYLKGHLTTDLNLEKKLLKHSKRSWDRKTIRTTPWLPKEITYANMMGYKGPLDDPAMSMRDMSMVSIAKSAMETPENREGASTLTHSAESSGMLGVSACTSLTVSTEASHSREATTDAGLRVPSVPEAMELDVPGVSLADKVEISVDSMECQLNAPSRETRMRF